VNSANTVLVIRAAESLHLLQSRYRTMCQSRTPTRTSLKWSSTVEHLFLTFHRQCSQETACVLKAQKTVVWRQLFQIETYEYYGCWN